MVITSRQNAKIKALVALRDEPREELLIEGQHLISMALEAGLLIEVFGFTPFKDEPTTIISREVAQKLSSKVSNDGYFAHIRKPNLPFNYQKPLLYLDEISDPGNMGTLLRTALAFDFGGVIISPNSAGLFNPKVLSGAQGAHFLLPLAVSELPLEKLREHGYKIVATALNESELYTLLQPAKYVLVLGNEARGVTTDILDKSDYIVRIPITNIDSLNVSVAGGILMHVLTTLKVSK